MVPGLVVTEGMMEMGMELVWAERGESVIQVRCLEAIGDTNQRETGLNKQCSKS